MVGAMAELGQRYGITRWVADPSGAAQIETLRRQGFSVIPARHGNKIALRVQLVGGRLNRQGSLPGLFISPECPNGITELETLGWQRIKLQGRTEILNDAFERGAPDHYVDALANVLAEYDTGASPWVRPRVEPIYAPGR